MVIVSEWRRHDVFTGPDSYCLCTYLSLPPPGLLFESRGKWWMGVVMGAGVVGVAGAIIDGVAFSHVSPE